ncbi:MAG TPA: hypothetical protein VFG99_08400, partial [Chloroflexia bacterium]|nr:hypothetical protein [Chloroflexia bacterium]
TKPRPCHFERSEKSRPAAPKATPFSEHTGGLAQEISNFSVKDEISHYARNDIGGAWVPNI